MVLRACLLLLLICQSAFAGESYTGCNHTLVDQDGRVIHRGLDQESRYGMLGYVGRGVGSSGRGRVTVVEADGDRVVVQPDTNSESDRFQALKYALETLATDGAVVHASAVNVAGDSIIVRSNDVEFYGRGVTIKRSKPSDYLITFAGDRIYAENFTADGGYIQPGSTRGAGVHVSGDSVRLDNVTSQHYAAAPNAHAFEFRGEKVALDRCTGRNSGYANFQNEGSLFVYMNDCDSIFDDPTQDNTTFRFANGDGACETWCINGGHWSSSWDVEARATFDVGEASGGSLRLNMADVTTRASTAVASDVIKCIGWTNVYCSFHERRLTDRDVGANYKSTVGVSNCTNLFVKNCNWSGTVRLRSADVASIPNAGVERLVIEDSRFGHRRLYLGIIHSAAPDRYKQISISNSTFYNIWRPYGFDNDGIGVDHVIRLTGVDLYFGMPTNQWVFRDLPAANAFRFRDMRVHGRNVFLSTTSSKRLPASTDSTVMRPARRLDSVLP